MTSAESASWLQRLVRVALRRDSPRGLDAVVETIGQAAGAGSAILWEAGRDEAGAIVPAVLAAWSDRHPLGTAEPFVPEPTIVAAFAEGRPITASSAGGAGDGSATVAFPVSYLDGVQGVLTLRVPGTFPAAASEVVADLLAVVPELCNTLRERQTLALANVCEDILGKADIESPTEPLQRNRLSRYLGLVCEAVGESLNCAEVSIYLQDPGESDPLFPLVASSSKAPEPAGVAHLSVAAATGPSLAPDRTMMVAPLTSGDHAWGAISCKVTHGPPRHFTQSDVAVLTPVSSQISQYWSNWLQRRTISAEIESWRRLARAVTGFNKLLADELKRKNPQDRRVYEAALSVVQTVVPDCSGAGVHRAERRTGEPPKLGLACTTGPSRGDPSRTSEEKPFVLSVYGAKRQRSTTEHGAISLEGLKHEVHWLIGTPISVGDQTFGVMDAYGPAMELPANSAQVCEIVGDQLGLYQHLRETLHHLREVRQRLEATVRGQAEALEDLEHQLVSPLLAATSRTERILQVARFDSRTEAHLRAVRGLCRKASRVAMSAGVFSALSKGQEPTPKLELHGSDDLVRMLITAADDAQMLSNPRRGTRFNVDRESVRSLGRRLVSIDRTFVEQCIGNILDNAGKYSYEGTSVDIRGATSDDGLAISVTSTGLALRTDEAERCLRRNWRGDLARGATGEGSGLGLWIADSLMHSMHGSIQVDPDGDRTTVRVLVPLIEPARKRRS